MTATKHLLILMSLITLPFTLMAQDSFSKTTSELLFDNSTEERFIEIYVTEGTLSLRIKIDCELKNGDIAIDITKPEISKKYGSFHLGGSELKPPIEKSTVTENVVSNIKKVINSPETGYYRVEIRSEAALGELRVTVEQLSK